MEAGSAAEPRLSAFERGRDWSSEHPGRVAGAIVAAVALALVAGEGLDATAQQTVNGLISGSYFALGAVGLTLVYGILKLVNFAHGDMLTFGAYVAFLFNVSIGMPFLVALVLAVAATAALGVAFEVGLWGPMRRKRAGMLQLLLISIGLAFVIRNAIVFFAGTDTKRLEVDRITTIEFVGLQIGRTELIVVIVGFAVLLAIGAMLKLTSTGKQMRALADDVALAEVTGIDTRRIILLTWIFAAGAAGLAGVLVTASTGVMTPNTGFFLLLSLFAATILGGIGNPYGALAGGLVIGLSQEWATLLIEARWKVAVSFLVLILVLLVRPQGIFGKSRTV